MTWGRVAEQLQYAHAQWQVARPDRDLPSVHPVDSLPRERAEAYVAQARDVVAAHRSTSSQLRDSSLIVTKAPHTGSDQTVVAIVARCIAFGLTVERVVRQPAADADRIAHALYPDVWLNFARLPSGQAVWSRIDRTFDKDQYSTIFGEHYQRAAVVTGRQACTDNNLTHADLMRIWQTGREPLARADAIAAYGQAGADGIFRGRSEDSYGWYRGSLPVGIHKISSSLMAFALRHPRLYGGRPVIVLNGHYTLLSQRFSGDGDRGPAVIEIGLEERPAIHDIRHRLIGAADQPSECLPGTIRRDALDGCFDTDSTSEPIVPWANAVHASDGYLAGAIETAAVLGGIENGGMARRLRELGYAQIEIDALIMKDPIVIAHGDEKRLTKLTAMQSRDECMTTIRQYFPPLGRDGAPPASAYVLSTLIGGTETDRRVDVALDQPQSVPGSRRPPPSSVRGCETLPSSLRHKGEALIAAGGLGLLAPVAGSGGRFGGYDVAEARGARLKPLRPVFKLGRHEVSSMDVRAAHVRFLGRHNAAPIPMLLSCSSATAPSVRSWLTRHQDLDIEAARVPEMYRIGLDHWDGNANAPDVSGADDILRDIDGRPILKPSGNLGLITSAVHAGALTRWKHRGVQVVVAANADDVGFRVDPLILGMFATEPTLDAVVLTTSALADGTSEIPRGGLLRERAVENGWSAYIEEHASAPDRPQDEHLNTNQIYFRLDSLRQVFDDSAAADMDATRRILPLYFEVKQVRVGDRTVGALHAYQTYPDVLRLFPSVTALSMTRLPRPGQAGGFAPLKTPSDVEFGQEVLDSIGTLGDELSFVPPPE
jgi:hypothetical protein